MILTSLSTCTFINNCSKHAVMTLQVLASFSPLHLWATPKTSSCCTNLGWENVDTPDMGKLLNVDTPDTGKLLNFTVFGYLWLAQMNTSHWTSFSIPFYLYINLQSKQSVHSTGWQTCTYLASFPGPCPASRHLQYGKALCRTASDGKLGDSLGTRLVHTSIRANYIIWYLVVSDGYQLHWLHSCIVVNVHLQ